MSKEETDRVVELFESIKGDLKALNDTLLPALVQVMDDKLKTLGCIVEAKRINNLEDRLEKVEREIAELKKAS